jgi:peptidoglycan/LPS O-acetylase OafA/YrhL
VTLAAGGEAGALTRAHRLQRVGALSYGLYVYHLPLRDVAGILGVSVERWTVAWGSYLLAQLAFLALVGGASYLAALASWRWLERPLLERGRRHVIVATPSAEPLPLA